MSSETFVDKMKSIQNSLLEFLEDESDSEDKYESFINLVSTQQIINEEHEFKELLQLISIIMNGHHRVLNFISKAEQILRQFNQSILNYFDNSEIFDIFKNNKRILLFLIEEKILTVDEYIFSIITKDEYIKKKYCEYFQPEIKQFLAIEIIYEYSDKNDSLINDEFINRMNKEIEKDFYEKRRIGENDGYLCQLIRLDKINEFVMFVEQTNLSADDKIKESIFETNQLLIDKSNVTILEYALFFGSLKIINYLIRKTNKADPEMWIYSIHTNNAKLIHLLEDYQIEPDSQQILRESIKCHHNNISNYIINNLIEKEDIEYSIEYEYYGNIYQYAVESHNYCFFPANLKTANMFSYLCEFDYYSLVKLYLSEGNINIKAKIQIINYLNDILNQKYSRNSIFFLIFEYLNDLWNLTLTFKWSSTI
ncbi:hypothetical protein M9Y10_016944 [Tritrichomonas musculus]|uniref:DUF3447 domain-containing protein n=1 Tax=Tritrichomonas musculus TaxID=1915356 RepID=A0ABR2HYF8_9EUKA